LRNQWAVSFCAGQKSAVRSKRCRKRNLISSAKIGYLGKDYKEVVSKLEMVGLPVTWLSTDTKICPGVFANGLCVWTCCLWC
jgi:hypothetical protein